MKTNPDQSLQTWFYLWNANSYATKKISLDREVLADFLNTGFLSAFVTRMGIMVSLRMNMLWEFSQAEWMQDLSFVTRLFPSLWTNPPGDLKVIHTKNLDWKENERKDTSKEAVTVILAQTTFAFVN